MLHGSQTHLRIWGHGDLDRRRGGSKVPRRSRSLGPSPPTPALVSEQDHLRIGSISFSNVAAPKQALL
jgi:hypothetical protein